MLIQVNQWHLKLKSLKSLQYDITYESQAHRLLVVVFRQPCQDASLLGGAVHFSNITAIGGLNQVHRVSSKGGGGGETWNYVKTRDYHAIKK